MQDRICRYYSILGVTPNTTAEELKTAYRIAVKRWHPDRTGDKDKKYAEEMLKEINRAYTELLAHKQGEYPRRVQAVEDYSPRNLRRSLQDFFRDALDI